MKVSTVISSMVVLLAISGPSFGQEHLGPDARERFGEYMSEVDREAMDRHDRFHEQNPGRDCAVRDGAPFGRTGRRGVIDLKYTHTELPLATSVPSRPAQNPLRDLFNSVRERVNTSAFPDGYGGIERIPGVEKVLGEKFNAIGGAKGGGIFVGGGYRGEFGGGENDCDFSGS